PALARFGSLTELTLLNIAPGDRHCCQEQFIQLLANSPGLRKLHLSIQPHLRKVFQVSDKYTCYFDDICDLFGDTGALPLRLESLKLSGLLCTWRLASLEKLTDPTHLKEVYISNRFLSENISYRLFEPAHCPNLRHFGVDEYNVGVHNFLSTIGDRSFARQLAISCIFHVDDCEMWMLQRKSHKKPALPLHFRMLEIDLRRRNRSLKPRYDSEAVVDESPGSDEAILSGLVSNDVGVLEGLLVHVPVVYLSGTLKEDYTYLTRFDYLDLLERTISGLPSLTQLVIQVEDLGYTESSIRKAAMRCAAAAPELRYLKLYDRHYRIWPQQGWHHRA
ncbi:hypothetical protein B0T24DRAFT_538050, partial [Lasiosphaeria ovina]